jgi:hydrogenase-4 component E
LSAATLLAEAVPNLAGAAMLLLGFLLPLRARSATGAARLVAWQGGLLACAAGAAAWGGAAGPQLWPLAIGALAGRALPLPTLLRLATGCAVGDPPRRSGGAARRSSVSDAVTLLAGGGLAVLSAAAVLAAAGTGMEQGTREGLALALATLLTGLLAMLLRRGVVHGLLGLVAAENGALLALVHAGDAAVPGAAALAVLSPGIAGCVALASRRRDAFWEALPWAPRR